MIELTKKRMLDLAQSGTTRKGGVNVGKAFALGVTTPQTKPKGRYL